MFNLPTINWNDIKQLDVTQLDPTKFEMPKFDMPKFDMPELDLPAVPQMEIPAELERVADLARDAAYAGVGAVVITVQKADERRREMTGQVTTRVRRLVDAV